MTDADLLRQCVRAVLLQERARATRKRTKSGATIYGPVYRATARPGPGAGARGDHVLFWADTPRTKEFGKHVTKAKIRFRNPYGGSWYENESVVDMMSNADIMEFAESEHIEFEDAEDAAHEVIEFLTDAANLIAWQDPKVIAAIKAAGFDGVVSSDAFGGTTEYVTFSPKQYKVLDSWIDEERTGEIPVNEQKIMI